MAQQVIQLRPSLWSWLTLACSSIVPKASTLLAQGLPLGPMQVSMGPSTYPPPDSWKELPSPLPQTPPQLIPVMEALV